MLHTAVPADPVNFNLLEIVQFGHVVESNASIRHVLNVFHYARFSGAGVVNRSAIASNLGGNLSGPVSNVLSVDYVADGCTVRALDAETDAPDPQPTLWATGLVAGDRMPSYGAVYMGLKTGVRGRSFLGSKHFGPIAESSTTLDELNAGALTDWADVVTAMLASLSLSDGVGNVFNLVVLSRKLSVLTGASISFCYADVIDVVVSETMGTMRHRKQRRPVS